MVVPAGEVRERLFCEAHSTVYTMHPGSNKMFQDLRTHYWWPVMKREITEFTSRCLTCQQVDFVVGLPLSPQKQTDLNSDPFGGKSAYRSVGHQGTTPTTGGAATRRRGKTPAVEATSSARRGGAAFDGEDGRCSKGDGGWRRLAALDLAVSGGPLAKEKQRRLETVIGGADPGSGRRTSGEGEAAAMAGEGRPK
ncbi:unnamed protein product [Cuscuta campestris]|uniref:Integrase zinc-binding domain-containing protein n=1 Tax=Cuscuta campestris TaxID=132261 RepID=A0A484MZF4_9ASTE|nr:unnamed protein product [Cuscuta campestris]